MIRQPNVVLFITHDTGRFISPLGVRTVATPHCERLAHEGVTFTNVFSTAPLCSPSRASITTGTWPQQNGMLGLAADAFGGFTLDVARVSHAASLFQHAGYESVLCGFQHESQDCTSLGFSRFLSGPGTRTNGPLDSREHPAAIDRWLAERDRSRPFYLQIGSHETHLDWDAHDTTPDRSLGLTVPPFLHDLPEVREAVAALQGATRRMDDVLGAIMQVLESRGVAGETLFVFTTDHGMDLPMAKGTLYDPGIEALQLIRWPNGRIGQGSRIDTMLSHIDLLPTLLDACGIEAPPQCVGRSFLPLLRGDTYEPPDRIFAGKTFHDDYEPVRCVRSARWKYIRYFEAHFHHDLRTATIDRRHWVRDPARLKRRGHEELFDLQADPGETHNLAFDPAFDGALVDQRAALLAWMRAHHDPLLDGPVESPKYRKLREQLLHSEPLARPASGTHTSRR